MKTEEVVKVSLVCELTDGARTELFTELVEEMRDLIGEEKAKALGPEVFARAMVNVGQIIQAAYDKGALDGYEDKLNE